MKQKYRLTVVFEFDSVDDVQARQWAGKIIDKVGHAENYIVIYQQPETLTGEVVLEQKFKLQKIHDNKPPERMSL